METLLYQGSTPLAFTLPDGQEFILISGESYKLPTKNEYIRGLIEQGYLVKPASKPKSLNQNR